MSSDFKTRFLGQSALRTLETFSFCVLYNAMFVRGLVDK